MDEKRGPPSPWERLEKTRARLAADQGVSIRTLQRRFNAEREREKRMVIEASGKAEKLDRYDYPYMELVTSAPEDGEHEWCQLEPADQRNPGAPRASSLDRGKVHVGGSVRSLTGGTVTTDDSSRTDGKPQPTSYDPDPQLKGGKG